MQLLSIKMKELMNSILQFNYVMDIYDYPHSSTDRTLTLVRDTSLNLVVGPPSIMLYQVCLFILFMLLSIELCITFLHLHESWMYNSSMYYINRFVFILLFVFLLFELCKQVRNYIYIFTDSNFNQQYVYFNLCLYIQLLYVVR